MHVNPPITYHLRGGVFLFFFKCQMCANEKTTMPGAKIEVLTNHPSRRVVVSVVLLISALFVNPRQ